MNFAADFGGFCRYSGEFCRYSGGKFYPGVFTIGALRCIITVGSHPFCVKEKST